MATAVTNTSSTTLNPTTTTTTTATTTTALAKSATSEEQHISMENHNKLKNLDMEMERSNQHQHQYQHQHQHQQATLLSKASGNNKNHSDADKSNHNITTATAISNTNNNNNENNNSSSITTTSTTLLHRKQFTLISETSNTSFSSASVAGSIQDDMISADQCSLTQAGLEEYNIRSSSYYDQPVLYHHQKQSSYAQSEGYHSYVSSSDSSSATPFLDRLRQESELLSRQSHHWSQNDLSSVSCASVAPSPIPLLSASNGRLDNVPIGSSHQHTSTITNHHGGNNGGNTVNSNTANPNNNNNNSSESTSSTETLKWLGSMSDVSEASHTTGYSAISESISSSQLIAHSSRVLTPKRHHSESVLYLNDEQQQQQQQQQSPNAQSSLTLSNATDTSTLERSAHSPLTSSMRLSSNHRHSPSYPPMHTSLTLYPYQSEQSTASMTSLSSPTSSKTSVPDLPKSSLGTVAGPSSKSAPAEATQHKSSISVTISSGESVVTISPQPSTHAASPGEESSPLITPLTPLSVVTSSTGLVSDTSPLTSASSTASSYRSNHRLFPVSTYTEPVHNNTSQFVHHPKPQYSTGLQKPIPAPVPTTVPIAPPSTQQKNSPSVPGQTSPQSCWQSVAELINDFERGNDQTPQKYTYIEPSKTHRVSNPALKAFQKNAVQSYFERQQQQQQQQLHSKEHNQQKLYQSPVMHHHVQHQQQQQQQQMQQPHQQQQLLRPHSFQAAASVKDTVSQQLLRNSLPNTYGPPHHSPSTAAAATSGAPAMRGMSVVSPQRPVPPPDETIMHTHIYNSPVVSSKPPSPAPPPPPPRSRSLMPTLLRRSSSASDYAEFRDQYVRASQEKLQSQSIKNISSAEKVSFNDCGMPPPPPPPRSRASLPVRRTSSASEYAAMREKALLQQAAALAHQQHHPQQHMLPAAPVPAPPRNPHYHHHHHHQQQQHYYGPSATLVDGWVPERPPKNPNLRIPSPDLPPPPADLDTSLSDEPLPPPPPELLHRQGYHENATASNDDLRSKASSPNRRNSFAGSSTRRSFFARSSSTANEPSANFAGKIPPLIPKKPTNIEILHVAQLPTSAKAQKVLINGNTHAHLPLPQTAQSPQKLVGNRKRPHNPAVMLSVPPIMENVATVTNIKTPPYSAAATITTKTSPPPPLMPRMSTVNSPGQGNNAVVINNKIRCNSKASYLPRQSLEKLNSTDPDHGSYKLTLTSNEDLVAHTKPTYDILAQHAHHNGKLPNNLPDVLPLGAKLQSQPQPQTPTHPTSPTTPGGGVSCLRYGSNSNLASMNTPAQLKQQQQMSSCYTPMYAPPQHHRYSSPTLSSYGNKGNNNNNNNNNSSVNHGPSYTRSQSFDVHASNSSPTKFMSQSTLDLKRTQNLETTLEEPALPETSKVLSPAQSEINLHSASSLHMKPLSPSTARREFHRSDHSGKLSQSEETRSSGETTEGRIFRAELVNTTISTSPSSNTHKTIIRKDSLRENIEKITQLQSQLMSAHLSESGNSLLSGYTGNKPTLTPKPVITGASTMVISVENPSTQQDTDRSDNEQSNKTNCSIESVPKTNESQEHNTEVDSSPPLLPTTPPPMPEESNTTEAETTTSSDKMLIVSQISQMDSSTDGLKLMQRSEIILRVNPSTTEAASQTDDLADCDMGRLVLHNSKEEPPTRTTLQPRQRHPIEIDCDNISKELASLLTPNDKLIDILIPHSAKCASDYVSDLYNPDVPLRPVKRDVGTSTLMRMKVRETREVSPEGNSVTVELQFTEVEVTLTNGSDSDSCDAIKQKVDELIRQLNRKIRILGNEQTTLGEEATINDELGLSLIDKLTDKIRPLEASKCRTYIDDVGHITSLLLSLSERLARVENSLHTLEESSPEKKIVESKRDRLLEQLEEAKRLKENIDKRGNSVTSMLEKNLSADEYADFDYFINMKAKLIADARDIADKIKLGEEQLCALSEALTQSDC